MVAFIDNEHFPEIGRQIGFGGDEFDQPRDGPVARHRDKIALHQSPGRFLGVA